MELWQLIALVGGLAVSGAYNLVRTRPQRAARREARRLLRDGSRELVDGAAVTLVGTARPVGEPLVAPLSGRAAIAYRASCKLAMLEPPEDITRSALASFELVTADGPVTVEGAAFELAFAGRAVTPAQPIREEAFLTAAGRSISIARGAVFDEAIVEPGATISVHGVVRTEIAAPGAETGYRETAMRHRIVGEAGHPIAIGPA